MRSFPRYIHTDSNIRDNTRPEPAFKQMLTSSRCADPNPNPNPLIP